MFSTGHLLWIGISILLIAAGTAASLRRRPAEDRFLKICLAIGVVSEAVKLFSVARILPMVDVAVNGGALDYISTGQYTPYLEMADLPLELCSLQIAFLAAMLLVKRPEWKSRLRALMYITGVIGGTLGIVLAGVTLDYSGVRSDFTSPRIYQFFLYHSMVVTMGLYMGFGPDSDVSFRRSFRGTMALLLLLASWAARHHPSRGAARRSPGGLGIDAGD